MIKYDETKRVFHLTNGSISYYIYVNSVGVLETLYFGEHLEDIGEVAGIAGANIDNCSTQYFDKKKALKSLLMIITRQHMQEKKFLHMH